MGDISILAFHESHMMDGMDAMDKRKKLGSRVRQLRYEHQINRKQFALMIGMDRG